MSVGRGVRVGGLKRYVLRVASAVPVVVVLLASCGTAMAASSSGAGDPATSASTWSNSEEVPGTAAFNTGRTAGINSVSCASAGNCSAGGYYAGAADGSPEMPFVVSEVNGSWEKAEKVSAPAGSSTASGTIASLSCASAGDCSAVGDYSDPSDMGEVFVVSEVNGIWGKTKEVSGMAALNTQGDAGILTVSCASAANCSAGGWYTATSSGVQAFVVSEVKGTWGKASEVPGTAALNTGETAAINSVSCASAGDCSAVGDYSVYGSFGDTYQMFVVNEVDGKWGKAEEIHGIASLNTDEFTRVYNSVSVSCSSAGNCSAGGSYSDQSNDDQVFVVSEVNGKWGKAEEVPGTAALNTGGDAWMYSVSCASAGNCSAGGNYESYTDSSGDAQQAFVVSEVNGTWAKAQEVPGTGAVNTGKAAETTSVSCASGSCSAGGEYYVAGSSSGDGQQAFVVNEVDGTWGKEQEVPGTAALNVNGDAETESVSSASAGNCSAGGFYEDKADKVQVFVVSETS